MLLADMEREDFVCSPILFFAPWEAKGQLTTQGVMASWASRPASSKHSTERHALCCSIPSNSSRSTIRAILSF